MFTLLNGYIPKGASTHYVMIYGNMCATDQFNINPQPLSSCIKGVSDQMPPPCFVPKTTNP